MNNKTTHTPGPWKIVITNDGHVSIQTEGLIICTVGYASLDPAGEADARLIASAPEMLEALKRARKKLAMWEYFPEIKAIDRALAKAEGTYNAKQEAP
jgi:hypothetical protein